MMTWLRLLVLWCYLAWRVCAKRRRRFAILEEAIDLKKEDLARLGFVYSTLSLCLCYRPIEDCCIVSYEAHLNIKEEFILGFFSRKGFPKENFVSLVYALYFTVHFSYWLYTCSWLFDILLNKN